MAHIIKTQVIEINLEEVIRFIKRNWKLLINYLDYSLIKGDEGEEIVRVESSFNLANIKDDLRNVVGLVIQINELEGAITDIFREIEHQNPHLKNMIIASPAPHKSLDVLFDIDVTVVPVMPVPVEEPASPILGTGPPSPPTVALPRGGDSPRCGSVLDDTDPEPIPEDGHL